MISARTVVMVVGTVLGLATPAALPKAQPTPAPVALVIGNGTYNSLPALPACLLSAHSVAAALRGAGFQVVEREDATSGGTDAAIAEAGRQLANNPGAPVFVYVCAYATSFNDRPFLLPISANITRPADVLTQGVLAKSLVDLVAHAGDRPALLALDVVPAANVPAGGAPVAAAPVAPALGALMAGSQPPGLGYIATSQGPPPDAPTPLATALTANLKAVSVEIAPFLAAVHQQLAASKAVTIAALRVPAGPAYLFGAPAPPRPAPPQAVTPTAPAAAVPPAAAATIPPAPNATAATLPPPVAMPAEENMTEADRRRVQMALAHLGYYDGRVDGIFGPDTRAAIRRFQHELGVDMSGRLSAAQASDLVAGR